MNKVRVGMKADVCLNVKVLVAALICLMQLRISLAALVLGWARFTDNSGVRDCALAQKQAAHHPALH